MSLTGHPQRPLRLVLAVAVLAVTSAAAIWGLRAVQWPIEVVRIDSAVVHADRERLKRTVTRYTRSGFFGADLEALRGALVALPWVRDASLRRVWPDTLRVEIDEHEVAARWNGEALVSRAGRVFTPDSVGGHAVPRLHGPEGRARAMLERLRMFESTLAGLDLDVHRLAQDARRSWRLELDNGVTLRLGHERLGARLQRFASVWPRTLRQRAQAIEAVDLRYTNGLAVSWSDEAPKGVSASTAHGGANDV